MAGLVADVKKWRDAEKAASERAKKVEEQAARAEEARKKAEGELSFVRSDHSHYLQEVLPVALDQARQQAVADYQRSEEFEARLLVEYKEGMRDMKASFAMANPTLIGLDWSFMPEISRETIGEGNGAVVGGGEDGEVVGGAQVAEDVIVIKELETHADP